MSEIEKALAELKALMKYRAEQLGYVEEFRGLGLTSRKNLCLHPSVKREKSGAVVDARCRSLTAGFVKEKKDRGEDVDVCIYHDVRCPPPARPVPGFRKENPKPYSGPGSGSDLLNHAPTESRSPRTAQSDPEWRLDTRRHSSLWRGKQAVSLLYSSPDGKCNPRPRALQE